MKLLKPAKGAKKWEGSAADDKRDATMAKRKGVTLKAWERSAADKQADNAAQRKLNAKAKRSVKH